MLKYGKLSRARINHAISKVEQSALGRPMLLTQDKEATVVAAVELDHN